MHENVVKPLSSAKQAKALGFAEGAAAAVVTHLNELYETHQSLAKQLKSRKQTANDKGRSCDFIPLADICAELGRYARVLSNYYLPCICLKYSKTHF
jgi:hypothetical protein